jgi:hypothetical protein
MNALRNEELFKLDRHGGPIRVANAPAINGGVYIDMILYTARQLRAVARLLRFTALGLDFTFDELKYSAFTLLRNQLVGAPPQRLEWWPEDTPAYPAQGVHSPDNPPACPACTLTLKPHLHRVKP